MRARAVHHRTKIREATQLFATALVERYRHPVEHIVCWDVSIDVIQRQEHGGQKGNQPLTWLDGRRVVFHTASLTVEIAATLEEVRSRRRSHGSSAAARGALKPPDAIPFHIDAAGALWGPRASPY